MPLFDKILIANRGEIAMRIQRTLKAAGIASVVVYHPVDSQSPAVREADVAYPIDGPTPVAAYLSIDNLRRACAETGASGLHPGYGFLSENAELAAAMAADGVTFIGPRPETIKLMGDKVRARNFVATQGFPVAPSAIEDDDPATFLKRAASVGLPLLIKPSAGGGGKGMRIVRDAAKLGPEIETARREALRYFGDGRLFVERYIENPRHLEVQVLGDTHGDCVHFWERECSIQRRFQKLVEESPSPALNAHARKSLCETAVGIARAANYLGAGTVEFIYAPGGEFYFLEMNTRLQVEHPVTEMVTGFDLVWEQIRVAAGEPLGYGQKDIPQQGHAIECRLCAEEAAHDFRPATGKALVWAPPSGPGLRVDSGIGEGADITSAFDSLLAKIIVHGRTRELAIARAAQALADTTLLGVTHNGDYLTAVLRHPGFAAGETDTGFLARHAADLMTPPSRAEIELALAAAAFSDRTVRQTLDGTSKVHTAMAGWRN